jgi:hypothetical protein
MSVVIISDLHPNGTLCVSVDIALKENPMADLSQIREHMEVIGADGAHLGTVDRVEGDRIKLTRKDSGEGAHKGHHHFIPAALVADIEGDKVRLSANGDVAISFEEEADGKPS